MDRKFIAARMNAERELFRAYFEWRRLARAETAAIQSHNWPLLADCQHAIQDFQALVSRLTLETRDEWKCLGADLVLKEKTFQTLVAELVGITRHNHVLLQAASTGAKSRLAELGAAGRNLKQLHRSYANGQSRLQPA